MSGTSRYRNMGPEKSVLPLCCRETNVFNPERRLHGLKSNEIRPIFIKTGIVSQASGSAYFEAGNLKVICSVHGPRQPTQVNQQKQSDGQASLNCDFKFSPFAKNGKRKDYMLDAQEKDFALIVQQSLIPSLRLELFPKSNIDLSIQILDCDGNLAALAAAITCASAALINAGIDMLDAVIASSAGFFKDAVAVDCIEKEEESQSGSILVAHMPSLNRVTHILQNGITNVNSASKSMDLCIDACAQIHEIVYKSFTE